MEESKLSKVVRPLSVVWILVLITAMIVTDGNIKDFNIKDGYLAIVSTLAVTIIGFYFSSKGVEKTAKWIAKDKEKGGN